MTDEHQLIDYQTKYVKDLAGDSGYPHVVDNTQIFYQRRDSKQNNMVTFRELSYTSHFTGNLAPAQKEPYFTNFDPSLENFLK